mmetsp:Transcript_19907/g.48102  ORF Transcript_19907/g.48102 Transcript_19907/m.48102 type:complete len:98 (+) Transcript_19907:259-552(+)
MPLVTWETSRQFQRFAISQRFLFGPSHQPPAPRKEEGVPRSCCFLCLGKQRIRPCEQRGRLQLPVSFDDIILITGCHSPQHLAWMPLLGDLSRGQIN